MAHTDKQIKQFAKVAVDCIKKERQKFAFDANLYKKGIDAPRTQMSHDSYVKLDEAASFFEAVAAGAVTLPMFADWKGKESG